MEVLGIIPARQGSKSVPHKNIRLMNGKPMMAYSIEHALASKRINRVVVSTDSERYAEIAKEHGAEVPFLRPAEYAGDKSPDIEVFQHALTHLKEKESYIPDIVVQLRPTYPIRRITDIDAMIEMLISKEKADSVRSIAPAKEIPYKMWHMGEDGRLSPIMQGIKECYNMPRQELPAVYYQNACIDVVRANVILEKHSMSGESIMGYLMDKNYDIDTEEEFQIAEDYLKITTGKKRFVFDIDGVIAWLREDLDYALAKPNQAMVTVVNRLYDMGNHIVLHTARGYVTGMDWGQVTREQLAKWGLKYHELYFGKPNADYYVDDRMMDMNRLLQMFDM